MRDRVREERLTRGRQRALDCDRPGGQVLRAAIHHRAGESRAAPGLGLLGSKRERARDQLGVALGEVRPSRRRRPRAEIERVGAEIRPVRYARERLARGRVHRRSSARVLGVGERAVADHLGDTVRPHQPHGVRSVL